VKFHKKLLRANGEKEDVVLQSKKINYTKLDIVEAKEILEKLNTKNVEWSWKDPRTCLFLDLWEEIIPELKIMFVYRHYEEVVDSLIRRKIKAEKKRRNFVIGYFNILTKSKYQKQKYSNKLLESWIKHNRLVLDFIKNKNKVVTINSKDLKNNSEEVFDTLVNDFGFALNYISIEKVFKSKLMKPNNLDLEFDTKLKQEAEDLYIALEAFSKNQNAKFKKQSA
jgi:hypothetical protein